MITVLLLILASLAVTSNEQYKKIHTDALVVDAHNDVVQRILAGEDISGRTAHGHSDLPRFSEGGVDLQIFSIWVPPGDSVPGYYERAAEQIDAVERLVGKSAGRMALAASAREIDSLVAKGKFVGMFGLEGGHPIDDDLGKLDYFYHRRVRYMTLTWNNSTSWATSASDEDNRSGKPGRSGLTEFGKQVIRKMNDIGMLVDISHVGEQTFRDVMSTTRKPVIASHSSVWKISPHRRNLKDWQLEAIRENGGVVFINFAPWFIDSLFGAREAAMRRSQAARIDSIRSGIATDGFMKNFYVNEFLAAEYDSIRPTISQVLDHFEYVAKLIGVDHVGIGSDFDGISVAPAGLDDVTRLPRLTKGLLERGFPEGDVRKILGGNFMRVLREAEKK